MCMPNHTIRKWPMAAYWCQQLAVSRSWLLSTERRVCCLGDVWISCCRCKQYDPWGICRAETQPYNPFFIKNCINIWDVHMSILVSIFIFWTVTGFSCHTFMTLMDCCLTEARSSSYYGATNDTWVKLVVLECFVKKKTHARSFCTFKI